MRPLVLFGIAVSFTGTLVAGEIEEGRLRSAVSKALPWLEKGAAGSSKENKCFTCHNHAMPILALVEARRQDFDIDNEILEAQLDHTREHLKRGKQRYIEGKGQGGQVLTAGYALWALQAGKVEANETTDAVTTYVLNHQKEKGFWVKNGRRPPSDGSAFTANFVALKAVSDFTPRHLTELKETRTESTRQWLLKTKPKDTEDSVYQLKALALIKAEKEAIAAKTETLLIQQKPNGGWAQTKEMEADAYATGTVLAALLKEGQLKRDNPVVQSGIRYLLEDQQDNGTWHVATRADGFQPYYETGFPHDDDQFISIAASSWATIALLRALPKYDKASAASGGDQPKQ